AAERPDRWRYGTGIFRRHSKGLRRVFHKSLEGSSPGPARPHLPAVMLTAPFGPAARRRQTAAPPPFSGVRDWLSLRSLRPSCLLSSHSYWLRCSFLMLLALRPRGRPIRCPVPHKDIGEGRHLLDLDLAVAGQLQAGQQGRSQRRTPPAS